MSIESMPDPTSTEFYTDVTDVQIDPFIRGVFRKINDYKQVIAGEFLTSAEINAIMTELDDEWRMLLGKHAQFTGMASFLPEDAFGSDGSLRHDFYEDETFRFNGVMPQELESDTTYDSETDSYVERHTYGLRLQVWRESLDRDGNVVHLKGVAETDEVIALEFPDTISLEGARKWLSYYHAEDIDYIDVDLYGPGKEECEVALRLAGHSIDVSAPHKGDERLSRRSTIALNVYTNNLLSFDSNAPYLVTVDGEAWFPTPQGTLEPGYAGGTQLAAIDKVAWLQPVGEDKQLLTPHFDARLLNETKDLPDTNILVPASALRKMQSSRYAYYYGYDAPSDTTDPVQ